MIGVDPAFLRKALTAQQNGRSDKAARYYKRVLKADPEHVDALHFYGLLLFQGGKVEAGIRSIRRALKLAPGYCDAHNNLGNILKETGDLDEAIRCYQRAVDLEPTHANAWNNLGVVLRARGLLRDSERAYSRATAINPAHAAAWQNYGNLLARLDRLDEAVRAYLRVLDLKPHDTLAYEALGRALFLSDRADEAVTVYENWLRADPGNRVASHMLAACAGGTAPERAADEYVRELFDSFSSSFDRVLDGLGYEVPALINALLGETFGEGAEGLTILDAGCGTGLCGPFLRPLAARLVGVDLSPGMLGHARERGTYDSLVEAELGAWLADQTSTFDLIVCADTLCYFGRLDDILCSTSRALRPGGLFIFTLERSVDAQEYALNFSGRYCHAEGYTRDCLRRAGFTDIGVRIDTLRQERGRDVPGLLVSATRPALQASAGA